MERRRAGGGIGRVEGAGLQGPLEGAVRAVMSPAGQTPPCQASSFPSCPSPASAHHPSNSNPKAWAPRAVLSL